MKPLVQAILDHKIRVYPEDLGDAFDAVLEALEIPNMAKHEAKKQDLWGWQSMSDTISLAQTEDGMLLMPRGFASTFVAGMDDFGFEVQFDDRRIWQPKFRIGKNPAADKWQIPAMEAMLRAEQGIYKAPAGSGKTVTMLLLIRKLACKSLVIVNTKDILWQWQERVEQFLGEDYPFGQIGDDIFDVSPYITIATAQTLHSRFEVLEENGFFDDFSLVCLDECFPAGTLISTPSGLRPIESLRVGDVVYGMNHSTGQIEPTEVRHTFSRESERLVEVGGVTTTPNHPIFTQRGYVRADELLCSDMVVQSNDADPSHLRCVPVGVHGGSGSESASTEPAEVLLAAMRGSGEAQVENEDVRVLRRELRGGEEDDAVLLEVVREQGEDGERREAILGQRPHDGAERAPRCAREDRQLSGVGAQSVLGAGCGGDQGTVTSDPEGTRLDDFDRARWTRTRVVGPTREIVEAVGASLGTRTHPPHRQIGIWLPASATSLLPDRHRAPGEEDRNRSGREHASLKEGSGEGCPEGRVSEQSRVDADPRNERGRAARPIGGSGPYRVHNIETGTGNYIAGGILVRNCHHATADTYNRIMDRFSARYRFGVSATPDKTGDFALSLNVLGPIVHETKPDDVDRLIKPKVIRVSTKFGFGFRGHVSRWQRSNYPQMIDALIRNPDRNEQIVRNICENAGHHQLVISKRLEHLAILSELLEEESFSDPVVTIIGNDKNDARKQAKALIESEPCVVLSTLADEAMDIPRLDRMHLTFPQRNAGLVTQQVGRVERKHPDKKDAIIFDYVDANVGPLEAQWRVRRTEVYMQRGYKIETQRAEVKS